METLTEEVHKKKDSLIKETLEGFRKKVKEVTDKVAAKEKSKEKLATE